MADALLSTPVALTGAGIAAVLLGVAGYQIKRNPEKVNPAMMGVMGAFVFAAQMVNFSIPGTGSSGHIVGGILLASLLGPWAGFLTLASVLVIQCLVFADGGLMALGCNIINMGAMSTLVAYPLIFRPLLRFPAKPWKIVAVSALACIIGLEAGALCVVGETILSGITALPALDFLLLMLPIHLVIGLGEGLATGCVICFVMKTRPSMLTREEDPNEKLSYRKFICTFAICAAIVGTALAAIASSAPDGLEWSILSLTGSEELPLSSAMVNAQTVQDATSFMPDYDNSLSGIVGGIIVLGLLWALTSLLTLRRKTVKAPVK